MKYFLFLLIFFPASLFAQEKKDSKVIVTVSDTVNLFNRTALALYERGYTLEQKDAELGFMATGEKSNSSSSIKVKILIKDSVITLTGQVANNMTFAIGGMKMERSFEDVYFGGMKGSILRNAWNELVNIGKTFGDNIKYSK